MNRLLISGLLLIVMAGCSPSRKNETGHAHDVYTCSMHPQIVQEGPGSCPICGMDLVPAGQSGAGQEIMLSERQMTLAGIRVERVGPDGIGSSRLLAGKLTVNQELSRVIASRSPGRIEKLNVKETGLRIGKGEPLYEIYSEELLTLQKEYLVMLEQYRQLGHGKNRYASFTEAAKKKLLLYGMTLSQIERLAETGTLSPAVTFPAPIPGIVTEVLAAEGQYVTEGSPLYRLEGLDRLWVEAELYPREAAMVRQGEKVEVIVGGHENDPVSGNVVFIAPEFRDGTQIVTLRADIPNPDGTFVPGMQASIVLSGEEKGGLTLPANAVIRGGDGAHVWIKTGEGTFAPRTVKTGLETFADVEILEGLRAGDSVVVSGAYLLYSELVLKKGTRPMAGMEM